MSLSAVAQRSLCRDSGLGARIREQLDAIALLWFVSLIPYVRYLPLHMPRLCEYYTRSIRQLRRSGPGPEEWVHANYVFAEFTRKGGRLSLGRR